LLDERLSTTVAHQALRAAGRSSRDHRKVIDQAAAVVILQDALEVERSTGRRPGIEVHLAPEPDPGGHEDCRADAGDK